MKQSVTIIFSLLFLFPNLVGAQTQAPVNVVADTVWNLAGSPYVISGGMTVQPSVTLTIEEGVVIKFDIGGYMLVHGSVIAHGGDNKIHFTSIRDDSVVGDTNGDGSNTTPAMGDWIQIALSSSGAFDVSNSEIKYGGRAWNQVTTIYPAVVNSGGLVSMADTILSENREGIYVSEGTTTITNSTISDNQSIGINYLQGVFNISTSSIMHNGWGVKTSVASPTLIMENLWWGDQSGPYHATNPDGLGDQIVGNVDFTPWLGMPPGSAKTIDPVIIVPGMMGSAFKSGEWMIDPIFHVYDNLIETLEANGYVKGTNLFPWGYDWRESNIETAQLLKQKIDDVKTVCNCTQVDIVAHSMGGLVARAYAQSGEYGNDIDQLIFLGTPHKGAPNDYLMWEAGEFSPGPLTLFLKSHFLKETKRNGYDNLFDYLHGWPIISVEELLPIYDYLKDATTTNLLTYPTGYPENSFLVDLNQGLIAFLASDIDITNVVGNDGNNTISTIRVIDSNSLPLWEHGYPEGYNNSSGDKGLEVGIGDGTVPEYSSKFGTLNDLEITSSHIYLPTEAEEEIYAEIHGGNIGTTIKRSIPVRMLFAKIFSPADFVMTAPDGKKVGKDFATGQEVNEIEGAFYSGFAEDDEYVTIPDPLDGEYSVQLQGTGSGGNYSFETSYIEDDTLVTTEVVGITLPNQITDLKVNVDSENPQQIESEREVTLDVLINDIKGAYDLGWIRDRKVRDGLIKQAKLIIKFEKKRNGKYEKKVDRILIKLVEKELDVLLKKGKINRQAFDLLKLDLSWIINNN
ncbi:MAG: hypothetical protein A3E93_00100 [Candidatus Zambryskibacteria bacterium RIFCSPHIGHO2_12_FULL_43_12b]|nr:MAG: hypothetical protein A3E93_00100 [Candidatus Zambryskibacteria bacterium RIFCSPHIGHO2_12_FULL_43_12b]